MRSQRLAHALAPAFSRDLKQFGPDDRNAAAFLDETEQVIPGIVVERADRHARRCGIGHIAYRGLIELSPVSRIAV